MVGACSRGPPRLRTRKTVAIGPPCRRPQVSGAGTASNGMTTVMMKLGFRHSNLSKSVAKVALFIGIFGP
jgi:hypothetical protein